ncbi:MAG: type III-A CRISPR-associated protein Csm2 [Rhodocyclaceae bacterium]|jgi:CRISPR-associated protein Csm2|nr:type III-A CRISPR-associated protein Csm2 [Rhodocyclaceae bacterium]
MPVNLAQAIPDPDLFDSKAENVARALDQEAGRSNKNKSTQIRRFYDELVGWQERIAGDDEKFKQYEAFIRMLNAKVAYAKGRGLVGDEFERWFRECIKSTPNAQALDHFRLHFEAVLGFLKALRG